MKTLLSSNLFLVLSIYSHLSFGNAKVIGNGGDVVVCKDNDGIQSIESLDRYEARAIYGFTPKVSDGKDLDEKVLNTIKRFEDLHPTRAIRYSNWLTHFKKEAVFLDNISLEDIKDTQHTVLPNGCEIQQLVVQYPEGSPQPKRYVFDNDLWNLLDEENKAIVILHELILREAIDKTNQNTNSIGTRVLNAYLFSDLLKDLTPQAYYELNKNASFLRLQMGPFEATIGKLICPGFACQDKTIEWSKIEFSEDGTIQKANAFCSGEEAPWYFGTYKSTAKVVCSARDPEITLCKDGSYGYYQFYPYQDPLIKNDSVGFQTHLEGVGFVKGFGNTFSNSNRNDWKEIIWQSCAPNSDELNYEKLSGFPKVPFLKELIIDGKNLFNPSDFDNTKKSFASANLVYKKGASPYLRFVFSQKEDKPFILNYKNQSIQCEGPAMGEVKIFKSKMSIVKGKSACNSQNF